MRINALDTKSPARPLLKDAISYQVTNGGIIAQFN